MVEAVGDFLQRYGSSALAVAIFTAIGAGFWWVADQAHRIKTNESEIHEIKVALAGHQDITPVAARLSVLEARYVDVGPLLLRLTALETQQVHLTTAITRMDDVQGRMADRLNTIDRRVTETSATVSTNQEIARKILEQQNAMTGTIADIKRALPGIR